MPKLKDPYAWNPEYGWQLLRRNKTYQKVEQWFYQQALRDKYGSAKAIYEMLSHEGPFPKEKRKDAMKTRKFEAVSTFTTDLLFDSGPMGMNLNAWYYRIFLGLYGDVLLFPISHKVKSPLPSSLNTAWLLRPVIPMNEEMERWYTGVSSLGNVPEPRDEFTDSLLKKARKLRERVHTVSFAVNSNFDHGTILDEAKTSMREHLTAIPKKSSIIQTKLPRWKDFESEYLQVQELYEDALNRGDTPNKAEIARAVFRGTYASTATTKVNKRLNAMKDWIAIFDR